jgi:hypothetical protein
MKKYKGKERAVFLEGYGLGYVDGVRIGRTRAQVENLAAFGWTAISKGNTLHTGQLWPVVGKLKARRTNAKK